MSGPKRLSLLERIERHSMPEPNSGCWLWLGSVNARGYATVPLSNYPRVRTGAHRASWMAHKGPIPDGLDVCHRCDVPCCVNPEHLFLGTRVDNMQDAARKGRTCRGQRMRAAQRGKLPTGARHYVNRLGRERDAAGRFA